MITAHPPEDYLVTCDAGATLGMLRSHCAERSQDLPIEGEDGRTIGDVLESGGELPRRARWGLLRDVPVQARFLRRDGVACRAGAAVPKSVSGYDVVRLLVGSGRRFGTITEVTLRTVPRPERQWTGVAMWSGDDAPLRATEAALVLRDAAPEIDALCCIRRSSAVSVQVTLAGDSDEVDELREICEHYAQFDAGSPSLEVGEARRAVALRVSARITTSLALLCSAADFARADLLFGGVDLEWDGGCEETRARLATLRQELVRERGTVVVRRMPASFAGIVESFVPADPAIDSLEAELERVLA